MYLLYYYLLIKIYIIYRFMRENILFLINNSLIENNIFILKDDNFNQ